MVSTNNSIATNEFVSTELSDPVFRGVDALMVVSFFVKLGLRDQGLDRDVWQVFPLSTDAS